MKTNLLSMDTLRDAICTIQEMDKAPVCCSQCRCSQYNKADGRSFSEEVWAITLIKVK
jgi:hypothetical protein